MLWAIGYAYIGLLCALALLANRRGEPMRRTAWILVADMVFGYLYSFSFGGGWDYSAWMVGVNTVAATIVLRHWAGRWQAIIGACFVVQIGTDVGRVASDIYFGSADLNLVYWLTTTLAYLQLVLLAGWWAHERFGNRDWLHHNSLPNKASRKSVGAT